MEVNLFVAICSIVTWFGLGFAGGILLILNKFDVSKKEAE